MFQKCFITVLVLLSSLCGFSQVGGFGAYQFLNLPFSVRSAALGGKVATIDEPDMAMVMLNPALLDSTLHNNLYLSYSRYVDDISYGAFAYGRSSRWGTFGVNIQQVSYGSFIEADETGLVQGTFKANELAVSLMYARTLDSLFSVGISVKPVYSHLERYTSFGLAVDIGGNYHSRNGLFSSGVVLKNIGLMLKGYTRGNPETLPFEIVAGVSQKLEHAPFRFLVTFHQLQNMNIYYESKLQDSETSLGENSSQPGFAERAGREFLSHLIIGMEFVPVKSFYLRAGYNYQRRNELKVPEKVSMVGFSWGFGIKVAKLHISYSRATYHLAGSTNQFSICTNLNNFVSTKPI